MKKKTLNKLQENLRKDFQWKDCIQNTPKNKPFVDTDLATVVWGSSKEGKKS